MLERKGVLRASAWEVWTAEMDEFLQQEHKKKGLQGMPMKRTITIYATIMTVLSVFLIVGIVFNWMNYGDLIRVSNDFVVWEEKSKGMIVASDYLSEQARMFVETGERQYMDNYFTEANETRRREAALAFVQKKFPGSESQTHLENALAESQKLMATEYKAMLLKGKAIGDDIFTYEEEVRNVELTEEEAALSAADKTYLAHVILYDAAYSLAKEAISGETDSCLKDLVKELGKEQNDAEFRLRLAMIYELVLIAAFIFLSIFIVILTTKRVFTPLIHSIRYIESDSPLPVSGAYELRMLAYTYNLMYETNRRNKTRLEFKAEHDALTGALNRTAFDRVMSGAEEGKVAFILLDIDNFKQINDNYGHFAGDQVLRELVGAVRDNFRSEDNVFRIGGDEFAIVLFGIDENSKQILQNKFNSINASLAEDAKNGAPQVTISAGVAFGEALDPDLMKNADAALYESKAAGKSCCSFFKPVVVKA